MSPTTERNSDYINRVFMQVQTLRKLETLYALFLIFRQSFFIKGKETEAVIERCSVKKVFLEISQNVQENTCATVSF